MPRLDPERDAFVHVFRRTLSPWYVRWWYRTLDVIWPPYRLLVLPFKLLFFLLVAALGAVSAPFHIARSSPIAAVFAYRLLGSLSRNAPVGILLAQAARSGLGLSVHGWFARGALLIDWGIVLRHTIWKTDSAMRRRRDRRDIVRWVFLVSGPLDAGLILFAARWDDWLTTILVAGGLFLILTFYSMTIGYMKPAHESRRNQRLLANSPAPYVLRLRSLTRRDLVGDPEGQEVTVPRIGTFGVANFGLLQHFEDALKDVATLVAVGPIHLPRPDLLLRSISFVPDGDGWFECAKELAPKARAILLVPDSSAGLRRELELIRAESLWDRTIVVMPPVLWIADRTAEAQRERRQQHWERIRTELREVDVRLPEYDPAGMLYLPDENLAPRESVGLAAVLKRIIESGEAFSEDDRGLDIVFREAFRELFPRIPDDWEPTSWAIENGQRWDNPWAPRIQRPAQAFWIRRM